jgi:radical SAM/Cys-rich protein
MPVGRYFDYLLASDNICDYMQDLENTFNPTAVKNVMCRTTISVSWDGRLYDCDFNQMLGLTISDGEYVNVRDFDIDALSCREIVVRNHCYGCTAGSGSSCQGSME